MKRVSLLLAVVLLLSVLPLGAGAAGIQLAFTQQPQDCTAMPGRDTAVFSVQAVGDPAPTYQWQLKKSDTWENLFLVTQPTYTISRVYPDMDGWQYRCLATSGEKTIASQVVTLHARLNDITLRQLAITPPVAGEVPMQELPETDQYRFPRGIFWDPELHEGTFAPDTVYTATVYLEAKPTYTLDGLGGLSRFPVPRKSPIPMTTEELSPPSSPRPAAIPFTIPSVLSSLRERAR
ncbi:MAG: hypothetical protein ACLS43_10790 [Evtepia gabavorous]